MHTWNFSHYLIIFIYFASTHSLLRRISRQRSKRDREEEELKRQLSAPDKLIEDEEIEEGSVSNFSSAAALVN